MNKKYKKKRRYKIKYKNVAILLAALLVIILAIVAICSPGKSDDKDKDADNLDNSDQQQDIVLPELEEEDNTPKLTTDPKLQTSYYFTAISKTENDLGDGELVLVNNNILFRGSVSEDELCVVREKKNQAYKVKDYSVLLRTTTMDALNDMMLAFYTETQSGDVMVISGHRTIEYQQGLYDDELESTGLSTSSLVSKAGYSEHHTGYAVDFKIYTDDGVSKEFDGTGVCEWIMQHCQEYGFVNRYPVGKEKITLIDNEPWHFRYVGKVHAAIITEYDFCLEEYIDFLKNYTIDTGFLYTENSGRKYIIYYVPMVDPANTTVSIPLMPDLVTPYPYEISGNNVDGWIVTVDITDFGSSSVTITPSVPDDSVQEPDGDAQ